MASFSRIAAVLALAAWVGGCGYSEVINSWIDRSAGPGAPTGPKVEGHVYLLRGLIGDIYSLGMDQLADKITRRGVAATVSGVSQYSIVADEIIRKHKSGEERGPVMLMGHSTGADLIIAIAQRLKAAGIPVALAFGFDPTRISGDVPSNVELFINIYQGFNPIGGGQVTPARDFRGRLVNVDLREHHEIVHINLDKSAVLHDLVAAKVLAVAANAARPAASARKKPAAAVPNEVRPLVLRYIVPAGRQIELWDSAIRVTVRPGETLETMAASYAAPVWAIAQINNLNPNDALEPGRALLIPRSLGAEPPAPVPAPQPEAVAAKPPARPPARVSSTAAPPPDRAPAPPPAQRAPRNNGNFNDRWGF
jgi:thioesterase domain-containing protein